MAKATATNPHLYILLGPEVGEKNQFITRLNDRIIQQCSAVDRYKFYPYDCDMNQIVSIIKTPSLFGDARFIIFSNCETFKKTELDLIVECCKSFSDDVFIVLLSDQYKLDKRLEELTPAANKQIFWELRENQKQQWIAGFFRKDGYRITPAAIERLLELVENNTQELKLACEALAGFYGKETVIDEEEIDFLIVHGKEENVFTLFNKMAVKDTESSLEALSKMALSPDGIGVQTVTMLAWQFRKLLNLKELMKEELSFEEACKNQQITGKKSQEMYRQALSYYKKNELKKILTNAALYDALLRSSMSKEMQKIALDCLILSCCTGSAVKLYS